MKIWINKMEVEDLPEEYTDAVVFNMLDKKGNLETNFQDIWRRFNEESIESISALKGKFLFVCPFPSKSDNSNVIHISFFYRLFIHIDTLNESNLSILWII